jgi:hypothetical protein
MKKFAIAMLPIAFLACAPQAAQAAEMLTDAQLAQLFPGEFTAVVNGMVTVNISARRNGTLMGQMSSAHDKGHWSVRGGKLCIVWTTWMGGKASCSTVKSGDGWYHGNGVKFRKV